MKNAVVFVAHTYGLGLTFHLARLAGEMACQSTNLPIDFFCCSHVVERFPGIWEWLKHHVPIDHILCVEDYDQSIERRLNELFNRYDRILVHYGGGYRQSPPLIRLKNRFGRRLILIVTTHSYQDDNWRRLFASMCQLLLYRCYVDHIVFQCPYAVRRFFGGRWLLKHARASVIPLGVEEMLPAETLCVPEKEVGSPDIRTLLQDTWWFNLIFLGHFRSGKGHLWLLDALTPVLREKKNVRVFFCGSGEPVRQLVIARIRELHLEHQVICPGSITRDCVPWVLAHCQAAIVPSKGETFGHCFVEPMVAGIPVVGTRVGVAEYLIQDMQTGIGFSYGNATAVCNAVRFMINHPQETKAMGRAAKRVADGLFSFTPVAQAHLRLYQFLLNADLKLVHCKPQSFG